MDRGRVTPATQAGETGPLRGSGKSSTASGAPRRGLAAHTGRMTGRIALITGASRGLGRSIALHLARQGTDIIGTYLSRRDDADAVAAEVTALGRQALMLPLDVADSATFAGFAATLRDGRPTRRPRARSRC